MAAASKTIDVRGAISAMFSLRATAHIICAGFLHFLISFVFLQFLLKPLGADEEMRSPDGPFRSFDEPLMLYPLLSPFVHAKLTLLFANACFGKLAVHRWTLAQALAFTLSLWAVSAGHGIFLDLCVFKMSWRVAVKFWAGSLGGAVANGASLAYVYSRRGGGGGGAKLKTTPTQRKQAK